MGTWTAGGAEPRRRGGLAAPQVFAEGPEALEALEALHVDHVGLFDFPDDGAFVREVVDAVVVDQRGRW